MTERKPPPPPRRLPPLPPPLPKRRQTPPSGFTLDSPTPARAKKTELLGALVSVFEELDDSEREDLAELGFYWKGVDPNFRAKVLAAVRLVSKRKR